MPIRALHFSDIHFGQEKSDGWLPHDDVREEALTDLKRVLADGLVGGKADLILITGDLAQKGAEAEFKKADGWLNRAKSIACSDKVLVRTVPGNHDVNLSRLDAAGKCTQDALRSETDMEKTYNFLAALGATAHNTLAPKLDDYCSFAFAHGSDFPSFGQPFTITKLDLPGGRGLRFIGLCSVLVSDLTDAKERMILGRNQYVISRDAAYEDIYLMHHPLPWLKDRELAQQYLHSRARVLMTGHEHLPQLSKIERDNGFEQLELAAGALNPPIGEDGYGYTFNWIEFDWIASQSRDILSVTVYPRKWDESATAFDADYARLAGETSKTILLDCGVKSQSAIKSPNGSEPLSAGGPLSAAEIENILTLPETDAVPAAPNSDAFEKLRYLFWHLLTKEQRITVLINLGLLTEHARARLPSGFERMAFEAAADQGKLSVLWDETMKLLPEAEQKKNPFEGAR